MKLFETAGDYFLGAMKSTDDISDLLLELAFNNNNIDKNSQADTEPQSSRSYVDHFHLSSLVPPEQSYSFSSSESPDIQNSHEDDRSSSPLSRFLHFMSLARAFPIADPLSFASKILDPGRKFPESLRQAVTTFPPDYNILVNFPGVEHTRVVPVSYFYRFFPRSTVTIESADPSVDSSVSHSNRVRENARDSDPRSVGDRPPWRF